jgi:hypothetical protein
LTYTRECWECWECLRRFLWPCGPWLAASRQRRYHYAVIYSDNPRGEYREAQRRSRAAASHGPQAHKTRRRLSVKQKANDAAGNKTGRKDSDIAMNDDVAVESGTDSLSAAAYGYVNSALAHPAPFVLLLLVVLLYTGVAMFWFGGSSGGGGGGAATGSIFQQSGAAAAGGQTGTAGWGSGIAYALLAAGAAAVLYRVFAGQGVAATLQKFFTNRPELSVDIGGEGTRLHAAEHAPTDVLLRHKQVFHVPGNQSLAGDGFSYMDAKAVCAAYDGATLATPEEMEQAYQSGASWCAQGWTGGQMLTYPTQDHVYEQLQKIPGHENDCGRPGVNGGYVSDPQLKSGVNCMGFKPRMTAVEEEIMANMPLYPQTEKDKLLAKRVQYWKGKAKDLLVSPWNQKTWSQI